MLRDDFGLMDMFDAIGEALQDAGEILETGANEALTFLVGDDEGSGPEEVQAQSPSTMV